MVRTYDKMYGEIIFKILIVVTLVLTFMYCWSTGNMEDYSFMTCIIGEKEKECHEKDIKEGMEIEPTKIISVENPKKIILVENPKKI